MHLVETTKNLMIRTGAEWVLWLLLLLSLTSIAIMLERILALGVLRTDIDLLRLALRDSLRQGGFAKARVVMAAYRHPGAKIVLRGMDESESVTCAAQADEAMASEAIAQRRRLEQRFGFLATLGANAPFVGLFGTVIGILQAFDVLGRAGAVGQSTAALAPQAVLSSIAEALVATAVGLCVAIPAVFAYNLFQRRLARAFDDARMLQLEVLSYLHRSSARAGNDENTSSKPQRPSRPVLELRAPAV